MKRISIVFILLFSFISVFSQDFMMEAGKIIGSFYYKNSNDVKMTNLSMSNQNSYGIAFAYPIIKPFFKIVGNLTYQSFNVKGNDTLLGNFYEWNANFFSPNLLFHYEFVNSDIFYYNKNGFSFYIMAGVSTDFLIGGKQNINNSIIRLNGVEQFDKPFFFAKGGLGTKYYVSQTIQIYFQYLGGMSFLVFGNYTNQEKLRLISHNISIGLSVNLYHSKILK